MDQKTVSRSWLLAVGLVVLLASGGLAYGAVSQFSTGSGAAYGVDGGPEIAVGPTVSVDSGNPVRSGTLVNISDVEFSSSGDSAATVDRFGSSSTFTNLSALSVGTNALTVRAPGKQETTVSGDVSEFRYSDMAVDDGAVDFYYSGSSGTTTVSVSGGLPSGTTVGLADDRTDEILDVTTTSSSGAATFDALPNSAHSVRLVTTSGAPTLSNGQPSGLLSSRPTNVSVDVSDPDLPYDDVEVEFTVDGSVVGSTNVTSNGRAQVSVSSSSFVGGQHTVKAVATDAYGQTSTTTFTFSAPSKIQVRNESNASALVDNATVDVAFYFESGGAIKSVTRSTSTGEIDLTGLPVDRPIVASATADGFKPRRIFLSSIYEQSKVYLLPDSSEFVRTTFELQDYSGDFPQDVTVLQVERVLNGTSYKTVVGDYFGANGEFPAQLAFNKRHRLTLLNTETGETRDLGTYTPLSSGPQDLAVTVSGQIEVVGGSGSVAIKPTASRLPDRNLTLDVSVRNGSAPIESYTMSVYKISDGTNSTVETLSGSSAETRRVSVNLTDAGGGELKVVTKVSTTNGGFVRSKSYGVVSRSDSGGTGLLPGLGALTGLLPSSDRAPFTTALAMIITLVGTAGISSRSRLSTEIVGVAGLGFMTAFAVLGWIGYDLLFVGVVAWAALAFARRQL
jgi:hypothetical protein